MIDYNMINGLHHFKKSLLNDYWGELSLRKPIDHLFKCGWTLKDDIYAINKWRKNF